MSEQDSAFWSQDYRGLAIVPVAFGSEGRGYEARYTLRRPAGPGGGQETVAEGVCEGVHASVAAAREAALDAGQAHAERLLQVPA